MLFCICLILDKKSHNSVYRLELKKISNSSHKVCRFILHYNLGYLIAFCVFKHISCAAYCLLYSWPISFCKLNSGNKYF